ncbi:hypothetical protein [Nocardioides sp.]|uniref:hypothetical protein n=1 Tax=Nocardioides sp. TaxID=35761 RepID=UPI002735083A|nr:hypothetical protein [Nocardioides sp.]MDP3894874.1 hypothetical protein [Nocardioides sp.]
MLRTPAPSRPPATGKASDQGSALVLTLMVIALVAVLTTTALSVTINNLGSTRRSQDAARALDAADAGVTQAMAYLRSAGARGLACAPACTDNPWGSQATPMQQSVAGSTDQTFAAWIGPLSSASAHDKRFRITSRGLSGGGSRLVQVDVTLTLRELGLPLGIFARSVSGAGTPDLDSISIFTTGCVWNRSKIGFTGSSDAAYGIPPAVHSSKVITNANGNGSSTCSSSDSKRIHKSASDLCRAASDELRWDQDSLGGACAALASAHPAYYQAQNLDADAQNDVDGTYLQDDAALRDLYGIQDDPLPPDKLEELRALARAQGNYWTTTSYTVPSPAVNADAVMFFDLAATSPGGVVDLKALGDTWGTSGCHSRSLLIVIDGGNVRINGSNDIAASLVLTSHTYGEVDKGNGTPSFTGTMFANTVNLAGTIDISLDACFLSNLSPSLYSVVVDDYRELDR